ncbi:MAG: YciC family protein [Candidatus Micrarchaeaceae archaeon]
MIIVAMGQNTLGRHYASSWSHLQTSVQLVRDNLEPIIVLSLLPALLTQLGSVLVAKHNDSGYMLTLTGGIWTLINMPAIVVLQLHVARKKTITVNDAYTQGFRDFWQVLGVLLLTSFIIMLGFICLIVPGFMLLRRYALAPYYVVDKNMDVSQAMQRSWQDSNRAAGYIWGTIGVVFWPLAYARAYWGRYSGLYQAPGRYCPVFLA